MVYGDAVRGVDFETLASEVLEATRRAGAAPAGEQVERCRELLLTLGGVAQAVLDYELARRGVDDEGVIAQLSIQLCRLGARAFIAAHAGGGVTNDLARALERALRGLASQLPPAQRLSLREPEGYAHYSLYPEQYLHAAQACAAAQPGGWCVIGIRSIGTSLGALVSEALGAQCFATLRPTGHPYARRVTLGPELEAALLATGCERYAIVDEGPGRSGSSFAAVFDWLRARGAPEHHIHFFPSHLAPPGPHADPAFCATYATAPRHHIGFECSVLRDSVHTLGRWFQDEIGESASAPADLSGGAWRALRYRREADYPPSHVRGEARKLLFTGVRGALLVKQLGIGVRATDCARAKRRLGELRLTPSVLGWRHGFLAQTWHADAAPLGTQPGERGMLLRTLSRYLTVLAREYPAAHWPGARPAALFRQLRANVQALLGDASLHEPGLERLASRVSRLEQAWQPVMSDNRLDAHEWLVLPAGEILKADAVEHSRAHDLIGRQDPAWDVAGAKVELGLDEVELAWLLRCLRDDARRAIRVSDLQFYELAYLAFRAAQAHLQQAALRERWPADAERLASARDRYRDLLSAGLR